MIDIENISWTYPHANAPSLRGITLRVEPGEFVVFCGASGSGKSTALRLLNGLVPHFHNDGTLTGSVTVDGLVTTDVELDTLGLVTGTVLQHPRRQFFTDTTEEEIAFALENFGFPTEAIRNRVNRIVAALTAGVPAGQRLRHLSGGQQQQVAIAAATAHEPRVLLLDEPSADLSPDAVGGLVETLARLKDQGVTVVVAEHRLRYLQDLVDRVIVLSDGVIDAEWSAAEFRTLPDDRLAAEGLRGEVRAAKLKPLPAAGRSVIGAVPADEVPNGTLQLEGVRCRLGGRTIVDLERVAFAAGEVTAIRGVNGAGKSTLARAIAGLERSTGRMRFEGTTLNRRARQRLSAIVMQDVQRQLFTETAETEIELAGAAVRDVPDVLGELDLAHLAERHPLSLSGGQQQRLVVATVRIADRRVVIFDEPSSGVDRRHLQSISDQIRRVAASDAVVLLISHDEDLLALAADRELTLACP